MVVISSQLRTTVVVSSIVLSAGTYLFDFGSNIVVLVEYSQRFAELSKREARGLSICDAKCRHQTSELAGYFYALLVILVCCHTLNAVLFKLKFKHSDAPVWAAYFLPLIHLYRLSKLLWRTLSCAGVHNLRSPEMNGLYSILGTAMEGVPMLILQFCAYPVLIREGILLKSMASTFKVSVAASLLSAAYNGGTSVESIVRNAVTIKQKICAGIIGGGFTLCAALTRCLTFANVIVHIREYFSQKRTEREQAKFHASDTLPLLIIGGCIITYTIHFWLLQSPREIKKNVRNMRRLLTSLPFGYVSMILGPLYPMLSFAADNNQIGCYLFRLKVFVICILHILLDVAVLCATHLLGTLPIGYLITSVLAMVGFLVFLLCYLMLDAYCGPLSASSGYMVSLTDAEGGITSIKNVDHQESIVSKASIWGKKSQAIASAEEQLPAGVLTADAVEERKLADATEEQKSKLICISMDRRFTRDCFQHRIY